jgi:hypothetical protein
VYGPSPIPTRRSLGRGAFDHVGPGLPWTKLPRGPALSRRPLRPGCPPCAWNGSIGARPSAVPVLGEKQSSSPWNSRAGPLSQGKSFFASWAARWGKEVDHIVV